MWFSFLLQLPDNFKDFVAEHMGGKGATKPFLAHCKRELMHAQLELLLDDDFLKAYKHGIVIICWDGMARRFYPRIFTYSADYPEKYGYSQEALPFTHQLPPQNFASRH